MTTYIDSSVIIGQNCTIEPECVIKGNSVLEDGCVIESFSYIVNGHIGKSAVIRSSRIIDSYVGEGTTVGPNAHLRENSRVGNFARIGNFVELKNSTLGDYTKAAHLAYVGDATVGVNCNIGCGVIFVNYDGREKHRTSVGDNCFIGSNSNLIAPLTIASNCFIACGTTLTQDLANYDFAIGRPYVMIKPNRAGKYLKIPPS
ncbi:MAG: DapH/DapD/GlmU-related protein [Clostridia bacterium]